MSFFFFFWPHDPTCRIWVPWSGIESAPVRVEVWSLNRWTSREVPPTTRFHQILSPKGIATCVKGIIGSTDGKRQPLNRLLLWLIWAMDTPVSSGKHSCLWKAKWSAITLTLHQEEKYKNNFNGINACLLKHGQSHTSFSWQKCRLVWATPRPPESETAFYPGPLWSVHPIKSGLNYLPPSHSTSM